VQANLTEAFGAAADVAVPVTTIYVGNLPAGVNEHMLQLAFAVFGTITACEVRSRCLHVQCCCRPSAKHIDASVQRRRAGLTRLFCCKSSYHLHQQFAGLRPRLELLPSNRSCGTA
jgi:RNA recognition motif. (a.k.a. RRM, RBD, or RNP domain)